MKIAKFSFAAVCLLLVIFDAVGLPSSHTTGLKWMHLFPITLAFFAIAGEQISKFRLTKSGLSIDQAVAQFEIQASDLRELSYRRGDSEIAALLSLVHGSKPNVWSALIVQRLLMRALLRRISAAEGRTLGDTDSLQSMLSDLRTAGVIDAEFAEELERIRHTTFIAEWGAGQPPLKADVVWTLDRGPALLRRLHDDYA